MPLLTRDIEPLWIARYDYEPQWHLPPHAHDDYFQIILIVSGTGEAIIGPERRLFGAGQMLFLRPRLLHGLTAGADESVRTLDTKFLLHRKNLRTACGGSRVSTPASTKESWRYWRTFILKLVGIAHAQPHSVRHCSLSF